MPSALENTVGAKRAENAYYEGLHAQGACKHVQTSRPTVSYSQLSKRRAARLGSRPDGHNKW